MVHQNYPTNSLAGAASILKSVIGRLAIVLLFTIAIAPQRLAADDSDRLRDDGWRELPLIRDGKIDSAWKHAWGGSFSVQDDGCVRTQCTDEGMGLLLYTKEKLGDCQIRIMYRCEKPQSNSGVYVRIDEGVLQRLDDALPMRDRDSQGRLTKQTIARLEQSSDSEREAWYPVHHGYEVQICDAADEFHRTGAIYSLAAARQVPNKDVSKWLTMIIALRGNVVEVDVDGTRMSSFNSDAREVPARKNWTEPKREHLRPRKGYIGLQNHDPGDVVDFREISVRSLPLAKP